MVVKYSNKTEHVKIDFIIWIRKLWIAWIINEQCAGILILLMNCIYAGSFLFVCAIVFSTTVILFISFFLDISSLMPAQIDEWAQYILYKT